jgi:hypothetical protein
MEERRDGGAERWRSGEIEERRDRGAEGGKEGGGGKGHYIQNEQNMHPNPSRVTA